MNEIESRALELMHQKKWAIAIPLFDELLESTDTSALKLVSHLSNRSQCCLELGRYEVAIADCQKLIKLEDRGNCSNKDGMKARKRLVTALLSLRQFAEAEKAVKEWMESGAILNNDPATFECLGSVLAFLHTANMISQNEVGPIDQVLQDLDSKFESLLASGEDDLKIQSHSVDHINRNVETHRGSDEVLNCLSSSQAKVKTAINNRLTSGSKLVNGSNRLEASGKSQIMKKSMPEDKFESVKYDSKITSRENENTKEAYQIAVATVDNDSSESSKMNDNKEQTNGSDDGVKHVCIYCAMSFNNQTALRMHCQTQAHQTIIMSDEGKDWKWRPPPRGLTTDAYTLCDNWDSQCRYGSQCVEAHSPAELAEWCERFEYRKMKLQKAKEKELYGKSYTEQLLERWSQASAPETVLAKSVNYITEHVSDDLSTSVVSKDSKKSWTFSLKTNKLLVAVALLEDAHRNHFAIKSIASTMNDLAFSWTPSNTQEWILPRESAFAKHIERESSIISAENVNLCHTVTIEFSTSIFGTFRQSVVFDFGCDPLPIKHFCVDVVPATNADKIDELKKELYTTERWDENNANIMRFSPPESTCLPILDEKKERELLKTYPTPTPSTFMLTQSTVTEKRPTKNNYRSRMHELLCVEEMARYQQVAQYNIRSALTLASSYLLSSSGPSASTAKYAHDGQLYAVLHFGKSISEDTAAGRLVLNSCTSVLLSAAETRDSQKTGKTAAKENGKNSDCPNEKRKVYEAIIEDKGKNVIYLKLSADTVKAYNMKAGVDFSADIQFQLNRIQYCEWHSAVDKIQDYKILFPETYLEPNIPWNPHRQWKDIPDSKLNVKQKEAIMAITTPLSISLPPILIIGPFGTGKTYTLAQAIKQLLMIEDSRILVCTHSNSAADIYIHDYLHPYVQDGNECARPLRIYYHKRWVATVNPIVQRYCLIKIVQGAKQFQIPEASDVQKHRVVVVTLSNSSVLASLGLSKDFFTHIFLDEAAQAMECEAIMPLALAGDKTRIVLAGDHMQLSPELFSPFAKERYLHLSLLERLYDLYPSSFPCKILLCENYRAHEAIIKFTSELFYDQKLVCSGKQPSHDKFYPLTFFTSRGEDVQDTNSTAFHNNAEVYEVVERVVELRACWPTSWGKLDGQSIGIMTPYADQVFRIRSELRRRKLSGISVERVLNVQGKQFRAIFLSTVRTRRTCSSQTKGQSCEESDYGFLSNSKLLNTAITRAQSLVAVVGDPIALCSIGRCRKVWERFIQICHENRSLFGIQWSAIRSHLDGVEFKRNYGLNPLAPEFIPRVRNLNIPISPPVLNSSGITMVLGPNGPQPAILLDGFQTSYNYHQPNLWSGPPLQYQLPQHAYWHGPLPQNTRSFLGMVTQAPQQTNQQQPQQQQQNVHVNPFQGPQQQQQGVHVQPFQQQQSIHVQPLQQQAVHVQPLQQQGAHVQPLQQPLQQQGVHVQPLQQQGVHVQPLQQQGVHVQPLQQQGVHVQPLQQQGVHMQPLQQQGVHVQPFQGTHQQQSLWPGAMTGQQQFHVHPSPLMNAMAPGRVFGSCQPMHPAILRPPDPLGNWPVLGPVTGTGPIHGSVPVPVPVPLPGSAAGTLPGLLPGPVHGPAARPRASILPNGVTIVADPCAATSDVVSGNPLNQATVLGAMEVTNTNVMGQNTASGKVNSNVTLNVSQCKKNNLLMDCGASSKTSESHLQSVELKDHVLPLQSPNLNVQTQGWPSQLSYQEHQLRHQQVLFQQQALAQQLQQQQQQQQQQLQLHSQQKHYQEMQLLLKEHQRQNELECLQKSLLKEQRKAQLGRILTPLVRSHPDWHRLIPGGVNLLNLVDLPLQQEQWYNHLLKLGEHITAKQFAEFMSLCSGAIALAVSDSTLLSDTLNNSLPLNAHSEPNSSGKIDTVLNSSSSTMEKVVNPSSAIKISVGGSGAKETEPVIMMRDLDPQYMLGDLSLVGNSVWAVKAGQLPHSVNDPGNALDITRKPSVSKQSIDRQISKIPLMKPASLSDSDDSGDELLSSINRQLNLEQLS